MPHHITHRAVYFTVFVILLGLLIGTVAVAEVDLGRLNFLAAMAIATVKAALIGYYFMHLDQQSQLTRVFAGVGFVWVMLLLAFTFSDVLTR